MIKISLKIANLSASACNFFVFPNIRNCKFRLCSVSNEIEFPIKSFKIETVFESLGVSLSQRFYLRILFHRIKLSMSSGVKT